MNRYREPRRPAYRIRKSPVQGGQIIQQYIDFAEDGFLSDIRDSACARERGGSSNGRAERIPGGWRQVLSIRRAKV
jgi:hypothetical protein